MMALKFDNTIQEIKEGLITTHNRILRLNQKIKENNY